MKFPIVWSWAQAEALICDYATLVDAYKGQFFEDGKPIFDRAARWRRSITWSRA